MKKLPSPHSLMSKKEQAELDREIRDDKRRRKAELKAFGKDGIRHIYVVQDACSELLNLGFKKKDLRSVTVTVQVELKNGAKMGRTVTHVDLPARTRKILEGKLAEVRARRNGKGDAPL